MVQNKLDIRNSVGIDLFVASHKQLILGDILHESLFQEIDGVQKFKLHNWFLNIWDIFIP